CRRKVRITSSHQAPYALGDTHVTMAGTKDRDPTKAATHLHEARITSNHWSAIRRPERRADEDSDREDNAGEERSGSEVDVSLVRENGEVTK
ncbi:hypothetical protein S83_028559, partial [Arachis hypogaea]